MKNIVKINEFNDIKIITNADAYLLSNKSFSYRFSHSFNLEEVKKIKSFCKRNNKEVFMLINKIFFEEELENLKTYLIRLKEIDIDGIFFTDFATFMLAKEINMADKCYFYHETFLRNTYDILTYQEMGIKNLICSKDMLLKDINCLPISSKENYGILAFGYIPLYESKRKVLSNFIKKNHLDKKLLKANNLVLKETTRDDNYKIIEQNGIVSIFEPNVLCYLNKIKELKEHLDLFIYDSLFFDASFINKVIQLFKDEKGMDDLLKLDASLNYSTMFLEKEVGLVK